MCSSSSRKSQLAIEVAHTWKVKYPEGWVFWIHASSAARFDHSVRDILGLLKIHGRQLPNATVYDILRSWLIDTRGRRWLLVLDNADEAEYLLEPPAVSSLEDDGMPTLSRARRLDYIPTCDHGTMLITTRRRDMCLKIVNVDNALEVRPMDTDHALELMQKKAGLKSEKNDIMRLAAALDFMPLAMVQAAAYIHKRWPRCSAQQYTEKLHRSQKSKLSLLNQGEADCRRDREASSSIISTWQISFEHVQNLRPSAAELLSLMSFFDRQAIPGGLLLASTIPDSDGHGGDNDLDESESDSSSRVDEFEEDIQLLRDYSFISVTSNPEVFEMHALVQLATQKWLGVNGKYSQWRNIFIETLGKGFPESNCSSWLVNSKTLYPHAMAALQLDAAETYAQPWLLRLLASAGAYAHYVQANSNAEGLLSRSLMISTELFGLGHGITHRIRYALTALYIDGGRLEDAEQLGLQHLRFSRSSQGENHQDTLNCMVQLSFVYSKQGRLDEAQQLQLQAMRLTSDCESTIVSMQNLAEIYRNQGKSEEAERLLLQALEMSKQAPGFKARNTLNTLNCLGRLYLEQGRLDEAQVTASRVLEGKSAVMGSDDLSAIAAMENLGVVYRARERLNDAELLFSRVREARATVLGVDHPETLRSMVNLASIYVKQRRPDDATSLSSEVVELQMLPRGSDHPDTLESMLLLRHTEDANGNSHE